MTFSFLYDLVWLLCFGYGLYITISKVFFFYDQLQNKPFYTSRDVGKMVFVVFCVNIAFMLLFIAF